MYTIVICEGGEIVKDKQSETGDHPRGERRGKRNHPHKEGAKTFRRGRALSFLESLRLKESILKKQLTSPELQTINPILVGELKALEMIIEEYINHFHLHVLANETELNRVKGDEHERN